MSPDEKIKFFLGDLITPTSVSRIANESLDSWSYAQPGTLFLVLAMGSAIARVLAADGVRLVSVQCMSRVSE